MRDKVKQFFVYFLIALCILTLVLPLLTPLVYADPLNTKVQQLIVTGDVNVKNMINAVENEDGHEGDKSQHRWVSPVFGGSVTDNKVLNHIKENAVSPITNEEIEPEQKAVVVFTGEDNLESKISGYGEWFDNDWLNRDSSNLEPHKYSATALGRAISGYTYYVLEKKYTTGSIPDDAVHIKYHGNPIADSYTPIEHTTTVTNEDGTTTTKHLGFWYWVEKPVKKPGYCKYWKDEKAKVYVSSLGPQSKALNEEERDEKNKKVKEFNSEFKKVLFESGPLRAIKPPDNFYDIFDKTLDANPYYKDGNRDSKNNYGTHFSDHTLNWIFHLFWNTILLDNPMEKPPEPLDFSLYALSSSLTAYCNDVLSGKNTMISGVPEIIEPKNAGQAGALVGYGDKDYEFSPFITSNQSSTASVVSYKALKDTNDNMYEYALYGRLLNDLGLDKTGMVKLGGMQRTIPGGVLTILYIVASSVSILFSGTMQILKTINPFSFLTKAQTISSFWREQMGTTNVANLGNVSINNTLVNLLDAIGEIYDGFVNISILGVLPIMLALLLGSVLLLKNANKFSKVKAFLVRLVFVTCGIPILGTVYTALLDNVSSMTLTTSAPTSQIISATFVDFEMWAKNSRLSPVKENGELFEIITSDDTKNVSGSDATYSSLRKIIANTNKKSGVIDDVDISMYQSADSENKVTANALAHINELTPGATMLQNKSAFEEGLALLQKYTSGAFYNASDFDSDTLAAFTRYHRDKIGSLQDTRKPEDSGDDGESTPAPPVENENTNEDTLYELFDNSNESKDWSSRSQEDNKAIFD